MEPGYPRSLRDFGVMFPDEEACRRYLALLRWPEGFECPKCLSIEVWPSSRGRMLCKSCRYTTTAINGTLFQGTRDLRKWFQAVWYFTGQRTGVTAAGLQRHLDLGSYLTAWTWLHKLRRVLAYGNVAPVRGVVEVDDLYIRDEAGIDHSVPSDREIIAIAAEGVQGTIGQVRVRRVADTSRDSLQEFVAAVVLPQSIVQTDQWRGYIGLEQRGFQHQIVQGLDSKKCGSPTSLLPMVHRVARLLNRWLENKHHATMDAEHFNYYLEEFVFHLNFRNAGRGKVFRHIMAQAISCGPQPYRDIINKKP